MGRPVDALSPAERAAQKDAAIRNVGQRKIADAKAALLDARNARDTITSNRSTRWFPERYGQGYTKKELGDASTDVDQQKRELAWLTELVEGDYRFDVEPRPLKNPSAFLSNSLSFFTIQGTPQRDSNLLRESLEAFRLNLDSGTPTVRGLMWTKSKDGKTTYTTDLEVDPSKREMRERFTFMAKTLYEIYNEAGVPLKYPPLELTPSDKYPTLSSTREANAAK